MVYTQVCYVGSYLDDVSPWSAGRVFVGWWNDVNGLLDRSKLDLDGCVDGC